MDELCLSRKQYPGWMFMIMKENVNFLLSSLAADARFDWKYIFSRWIFYSTESNAADFIDSSLRKRTTRCRQKVNTGSLVYCLVHHLTSILYSLNVLHQTLEPSWAYLCYCTTFCVSAAFSRLKLSKMANANNRTHSNPWYFLHVSSFGKIIELRMLLTRWLHNFEGVIY